MYSWAEDTSEWYGDGKYRYGARGAGKRKAAAERAKAHGPSKCSLIIAKFVPSEALKSSVFFTT